MDSKNQPTELQTFLKSIENVPTDIVSELLRVTTDEDHKNIINAFAPTFTSQFKGLGSYLNEMSSHATKQSLADAETFLKISSASSLGNNLKIALPSIGSVVGKLGVDGIVKQIKKIIGFLLDILPIKLPSFVNKLIEFLDEVLGNILGGESMKMKTALSQAEQNYMAELTQLAKLEKAQSYRLEEKQDEES